MSEREKPKPKEEGQLSTNMTKAQSWRDIFISYTLFKVASEGCDRVMSSIKDHINGALYFVLHTGKLPMGN